MVKYIDGNTKRQHPDGSFADNKNDHTFLHRLFRQDIHKNGKKPLLKITVRY
ncbi:MAG: hypothetical protein ACOXZJ_05465 [Bacteroidales bacterium]